MELSTESMRRLVVEGREAGRFTQDSPVMADVWLRFAEPEAERVDVLLTPVKSIDPASLAADVRNRLGEEDAAAEAAVAYSGSYVVAKLTLPQLAQGVLPLSDWWGQIWSRERSEEESVSEVRWLAMVLGAIGTLRDAREKGRESVEVPDEQLVERGAELLRAPRGRPPGSPPRSLWRATLNRPAYPAVARSRETVKADAVTRLFETDCSSLAWAIIDTGIDATHPAFRRCKAPGELYEEPFEASGTNASSVNRTRIEATYDLTRLRSAQRAIQDRQQAPEDPAIERIVDEHGKELAAMRTHLLNRHPLEWASLEPLLRVEHTAGEYRPPTDDHGTHVAGILAADWPAAREDGADYELVGLCPDLRLYDLRVFPPDGSPGDEFTVAAALQFVDYLNGFGRKICVAGANVSLSVPYEMSAFGCGQTPVCQESNRLVAGGVVVVAAAGNRGREEYVLEKEVVEGFRLVSLTDPGNAEDVITVGATHATNPHAYGVSYFSSRGPTGDGRSKPDLVAPGEKIQAPAVGQRATVMDGTSQAAPHVSGAAALVLARHRELIGRPRQVKQLLMESATDLGREPYFQGAGLVDALRAAQAN